MINQMITEGEVPEEAIQMESGHCMHPKFLEKQLD